MNVRDPDIFPLMLIRSAGLPLPRLHAPDSDLEMQVLQFFQATANVEDRYRSLLDTFEQEKDRLLSDERLQKILTNYRRLFRKGLPAKEVEIEAHLIEKRPDLASAIAELNQQINQKVFILNNIQKSYAARIQAEKRNLLSYAGNEVVCRSLLFGSHSLLEELPDFSISDPEQWNKKQRRTASALLKYVFRAATKTTPFSRLATVGLERSGDADAEFFMTKPVVTPNVALLPFLYEVLLQEPAFYNNTSVRINPSLQTTAAGEEWLYHDGMQESVQFIDHKPALQVLKTCLPNNASGLVFSKLITTAANKLNAELEATQTLVFQLIDYGYLEWVFPENGFSAGWAGRLYQHLGFLPSAPVITDAAFLLQWLRTAARTLPFQPVQGAMEIQREALTQCHTFFQRYGFECPDIPPEQIFYEDTAVPVDADVPKEIPDNVLREIRSALVTATPYHVSGLRAQIIRFGKQLLHEGASVSFLTFSQLFLKENSPDIQQEVLDNQLNVEKIGALFQIYKAESGDFRAVLNALYPGGGKMLARWLHLFPASVAEQLKAWQQEEVLAFPWQHWSNTNFHAVIGSGEVATPGGRKEQVGDAIPLYRLHVRKNGDFLQLIDIDSQRPIVFTDPGLDAPDTRPPMIQILCHLGVPFVSAGVFEKNVRRSTLETGVIFEERVEYQSIVLSKARWLIEPDIWVKQKQAKETLPEKAYLALLETLAKWIVPRHFFAGFPHETARYFDQNSPLLMQEFRKMTENKEQQIIITEMLPAPEQWVASKEGWTCAAEWAGEFKR